MPAGTEKIHFHAPDMKNLVTRSMQDFGGLTSDFADVPMMELKSPNECFRA